MKIEWLVTDVTAVDFPDSMEYAISAVMFCIFWAIHVVFCDHGVTLCCKNPLLSPDTFIQGDLMKIEWLVTNVTPV